MWRSATIVASWEFLASIAAEGGCAECLLLLTGVGIDANVRNEVGSTPVLVAACEGHVECLRVLLTVGADVTEDPDGVTPVAAAAVTSAKCLRMLHRHDAE